MNGLLSPRTSLIGLVGALWVFANAGCVTTYYKPDADSVQKSKMSVVQAKKIIRGQSFYANVYGWMEYSANMKLREEGFEFIFKDKRPQDFAIPYICKFSEMEPAVAHSYETYAAGFGEKCKMIALFLYSTPDKAILIADAAYTLKQFSLENSKVPESVFEDGLKYIGLVKSRI